MNNVRRNLIEALNEAALEGRVTQVLEYNEPERTPNAHPAGPGDSNVVVFQMMLHYKRQLECEQDINAIAMKKLKTAHDMIASLQHEQHELIQDNRQLVRANERGSAVIIRKHQAGMRMAACLDEMFETIDVVVDTGLGDDGALGMEYISAHRDAIGQRARVALDMFVEVHQPEEDSETEEDTEQQWLFGTGVIDLTGDETEEE